MPQFAQLSILYLCCVIACAGGRAALALDLSKGPTGANHDRAHRYATGAGVPVGVFDTVFFGIPEPHHLGSRLVAQYDFYNKTPSQSPEPLINPNDDHERLVADVIASDDALNTGVAPEALIYLAAINDLDLQSRRAASAWLRANHNVSLFNLSAQFGPNTNGTSTESLYWDWFVDAKDALVVFASGNTGFQSVIPADSFNGLSVGAFDQATQTRWTASSYALDGGPLGSEVRGKPDILAPGVWIGDGISFGGFSSLGTSFAAPHVTGAAALLKSLPLPLGEGRGDGLPTADTLDHRGIKALILNSARKRQIVAPEILSPVSNDSAASSLFDKDYLDCSTSPCTIESAMTAGTTSAWTPSQWSYNGTKFSATKPLDDEQGTGFLDATRAVINLAGGNYAPGPIAGIGWDQDMIAPADLPSAHTYALHQTLAAGSFLTATLTWDRVVSEADGNGVVDDVDTYTFGELANLDLRVLDAANQIVAQSISTIDNVEHLHIPIPTNGNPDDFKLQVIYNGGGVLATDFALAWWTSLAPLVPGDYNLDGTVDALDYNVWRANFATTMATAPLIHGDGNNDGLVDAADYTIWRKHAGETWSPAAATIHIAAVPECPTLLLTFLMCIALLFIRRRGFSAYFHASRPPARRRRNLLASAGDVWDNTGGAAPAMINTCANFSAGRSRIR